MSEREAELLEMIFNPYHEPLKQGEPTDVDAHWESIYPETPKNEKGGEL